MAVDTNVTAWSSGVAGAIDGAVDTWLSTVVDVPLIHHAVIYTTSMMTGAVKYGLTGHSNLASRVIATPEFLVRAAETINKVTDILSNPNIEGIPIFAKSEHLTHSADAAESLVLLQSASDRRRFATENVVPHPREWTIQGFIRTVSSTDAFFNVKPSIRVQLALLEAYMESRRPCWYKTHDCKFYKVNITGVDADWVPENGNTATAVTIKLKEYNPLILDGSLLGSKTAEKVDASDIADILEGAA